MARHGMWFDWQPRPAATLSGLVSICPPGDYRVVDAAAIPAGIISPGLLQKTTSIFIMCSGTDSGRLYIMMNMNRVDGPNIDQMPYAIAYDGSTPIPSGVLIQHANYPGRTTPTPPGFHRFVAGSGIYPLSELPTIRTGRIGDLRIGSQEHAFRLLVSGIQSQFPEPPRWSPQPGVRRGS